MSRTLIAALLVMVIMGVAMAVGYSQARRTIGQDAARRRMLRIAPMLPVVFALVIFGQRGSTLGTVAWETLTTWLPLLLSGAEWFALLTWPIRKERAGKILQDLGPHPARVAMWLLAVSGVLSGAGSLMGNIGESGFHWTILTDEVFAFSSAIAAFVVARSRVQVRERGLLRFDLQFRWDQIESWTFERGGTMDLLRLRVRTIIPWGRKLTLPVPVEQRPVFEQLLIQHASPSVLTGSAPARESQSNLV